MDNRRLMASTSSLSSLAEVVRSAVGAAPPTSLEVPATPPPPVTPVAVVPPSPSADNGDEDEDDDDDDDEEKKKKKKKGEARQAHADDDEGDAGDFADPVMRQARARERGRIRSILASEAGKNRPRAALALALSKSSIPMTRQAVIESLEVMPVEDAASRELPLRSRMTEHQPDIGPGDSNRVSTAGYVATPEAILLAAKRRRGET